MKKRSMLAIASLATGFVVAAVTPSHAADGGPLGHLDAPSAPDDAGHPVGEDGPAVDDGAPDRG
ncbi:hypothetical protein QQY24_27560 [Streptomyces sp. TG1A-8]|uniref:hypothetical protein n=1 Tax=Streptomyces sp. TG1A-8 TaxID=3051385 RepID=UPI00265B9871|nr:hypothetical protein [Streptomyces sp. TG1A-8]MDO0928980.1 hypothetical protein [Streptomyces sp. TG1A-8]